MFTFAHFLSLALFLVCLLNPTRVFSKPLSITINNFIDSLASRNSNSSIKKDEEPYGYELDTDGTPCGSFLGSYLETKSEYLFTYLRGISASSSATTGYASMSSYLNLFSLNAYRTDESNLISECIASEQGPSSSMSWELSIGFGGGGNVGCNYKGKTYNASFGGGAGTSDTSVSGDSYCYQYSPNGCDSDNTKTSKNYATNSEWNGGGGGGIQLIYDGPNTIYSESGSIIKQFNEVSMGAGQGSEYDSNVIILDWDASADNFYKKLPSVKSILDSCYATGSLYVSIGGGGSITLSFDNGKYSYYADLSYWADLYY